MSVLDPRSGESDGLGEGEGSVVEQPQSPTGTLTPAQPFSRVLTSSVPQGFYQGTDTALLPSREPQGLCWALLIPARSPPSLQNSLSPCPCSAKALAGLSCLPETPRAFARIRKEPCISQVLRVLCQDPAALQIFLAPSPAFGGAWAVSFCPPESPRAFSGLCLGPGSACCP